MILGINSAKIANVGDVLAALKELDSVAYVRYASVYHDFQRPEDFAEVLKKDGGK